MLDDYIYYNRNPNDDIDIDCVVRAISLALNLDYYLVEDMLYDVGYCYECEELEVQCYSYLLEREFNFKVYDIWDCTNEIADRYWIIE